MKKTLLALLLAAPLTAWSSLITVNSFSNIQYWTGSGTNQAALVLQWNDGLAPNSIAWGYRWNGAATGFQLLTAVAGKTIVTEPAGGAVITNLFGADTNLTLTVERYGFGDAVYSMVYSRAGITRTQEDWDSGYWAYSLFGGNFQYPVYDDQWNLVGTNAYSVTGSSSYTNVSWFTSPIGASARGLVNGSWDAWSFAAGLTNVPVAQPSAAVPEPRVVGLLLLAVVSILIRRLCRHAC
jgi:hypothetical protein